MFPANYGGLARQGAPEGKGLVWRKVFPQSHGFLLSYNFSHGNSKNPNEHPSFIDDVPASNHPSLCHILCHECPFNQWGGCHGPSENGCERLRRCNFCLWKVIFINYHSQQNIYPVPTCTFPQVYPITHEFLITWAIFSKTPIPSHSTGRFSKMLNPNPVA